jgi:peroxiredoxin
MRPTVKAMLAAVFFAALAVAAVCGAGRGAQSPEFTLESAGGERVSLREAAAGKPVLLVFWATWCPHCNEAVPEINGVRSRLSDRLQVLAINYMEKRGKVKAFMKAKGIAYRVLLDSEGKVAGQYNVVGIPTYIVLDRGGKVVYSGNDLPGSIEKYL